MPDPVDRTGGLAAAMLSGRQEAIAVGAVSVACGVYVLRSLPIFLIPRGLFTIIFATFFGILLGLAAAGALLTYIFHRLTYPAPPRSVPNLNVVVPPVPTNAEGLQSDAAAALTREDAVRDVTHPSPTMPHAYTVSGTYSGLVYTVTESVWDKTQCVLDWPPTGPGFKAWHATLDQGTLVLSPLPRHHHRGDKDKDKESKKIEREESIAEGEASGSVEPLPPPQQKVGIPLEGCRVELVEECLNGRSEMVRRAPLLLAHPEWTLLDGEQAIYIFAMDPAAKQQWLHALGYWCVGGQRLRGIDTIYTAFCNAMAQQSLLPFVRETLPKRFTEEDINPQRQLPNEPQRSLSKKGSWRKWRRNKSGSSSADLSGDPSLSHLNSQLDPGRLTESSSSRHFRGNDHHHASSSRSLAQGGHPSGGAGAPSSSQALPTQQQKGGPPLPGTNAADIDSIIEMRWMQSRKVPVPPAPPKKSRSRSMNKGGSTSAPTSGASSLAASPSRDVVQVGPAGAQQSETIGSAMSSFSTRAGIGPTTTATAMGEGGPRQGQGQPLPLHSSDSAHIMTAARQPQRIIQSGGVFDPGNIIAPAPIGAGTSRTGPTAEENRAFAAGAAAALAKEASNRGGESMQQSATASAIAAAIATSLGDSSIAGDTPATTSASASETAPSSSSAPGPSSAQAPAVEHPKPPSPLSRLPSASAHLQPSSSSAADASTSTADAVNGTLPPPSVPGQLPTDTGVPPAETTQGAPGPSLQASPPSRLPSNFPGPLLPVDFFMNAAATRICFDLVRNPAFAEHIRARVQRQLSRMHTPEYVQTLEVISVEPGTSAPSLTNFAAVPQPGKAVWPQLIYDVKYQGSFTVTIECKVDIRDGPAWSAIGQAINRIEGKVTKKLQRKDAGHIDHAPTNTESEGGSDWDSSDEERLIHQAEKNENAGSPGHVLTQTLGHGLGLLRPGPASPPPPPPAPVPDPHPIPEEDEQDLPGSPHQPRRRLIGQLRHHAAQKLRKLAETTATHISNLPLRVSLTFSEIEGTMCVWIPPPPGNRLFWSFLSPPKLTLKATPQLGTRLLKYAYHAARASAWIQARMELAFRKNLVFPCGGDVPLPLLLPSWDPRAADTMPGLDLETGGGQKKDKRMSKEESKARRDSLKKTNSSAPFIEVQVRRPQQ